MRRSIAVCALVLVFAGCEPAPQIVPDPFPRLPDPDLSRMLRFREAQLDEILLTPTGEELRGHLVMPDFRGQGQALRQSASVFEGRERMFEAVFPASASLEAVTAHLNSFAMQLPTPRSFTEEEVVRFMSGHGDVTSVLLGRSFRDAADQMVWEWSLFDPRELEPSLLPALIGISARAVRATLSDEFLAENFATSGEVARRLEAWSSAAPAGVLDGSISLSRLPASERLAALLPPFAAQTVNRWPTLPSVNCMQAANLLLYPQLNRYPLFYFDPMLFLGPDVGATPWGTAMEEVGAGTQVDEVNSTVRWVHEQVGASGDTDLYDLGAPMQTGTVIVFGSVAPHGFMSLGHAVTILGAVLDGNDAVTDYLVIEKENPGLLPIRTERLSQVFSRLEAIGGGYSEGGSIRLFAYTPEGDPLPFAEVDASLLHPDA